MTRAWAIVITSLALLGALSLVGLFIWACVIWGPYPILIATGALLAGFVVAGFVALTKTIYRKVRAVK